MTFLERYKSETTWWGKVLIMEIYHLNAITIYPEWTQAQTATIFECSVALVSENLRLAQASHVIPTILNCDTREEAIKKVKSIARRL